MRMLFKGSRGRAFQTAENPTKQPQILPESVSNAYLCPNAVMRLCGLLWHVLDGLALNAILRWAFLNRAHFYTAKAVRAGNRSVSRQALRRFAAILRASAGRFRRVGVFRGSRVNSKHREMQAFLVFTGQIFPPSGFLCIYPEKPLNVFRY